MVKDFFEATKIIFNNSLVVQTRHTSEVDRGISCVDEYMQDFRRFGPSVSKYNNFQIYMISAQNFR